MHEHGLCVVVGNLAGRQRNGNLLLRLDLIAICIAEGDVHGVVSVDLAVSLLGYRLVDEVGVQLLLGDPFGLHGGALGQRALGCVHEDLQNELVVLVGKVMLEGLLGHGVIVCHLGSHRLEAARAVLMLLGDLLLAANERALDLIAGVAVGMTGSLLQAADQVALLVVAGIVVPVGRHLRLTARKCALLLVAGVVMHVPLDLGQLAHELALCVVAVVVVMMGHGTRHGTGENLLLLRGGTAVEKQCVHHAQHHQRSENRHQRNTLVLMPLIAGDMPDVLHGGTLHEWYLLLVAGSWSKDAKECAPTPKRNQDPAHLALDPTRATSLDAPCV